MLKKLFPASMILISGIAVASLDAPTFYIGPSLLVKANTAPSSSSREASARMSAGYGGTLSVAQGIYIAGELFFVPSSLEISTNGTPKLKTTYSYGLSFIPGLMIGDGTMVFIRAGLVRTDFSTQSKSIMGLQMGVGIQIKLTQSWDLRGEYNYNAYHTITGVGAPRSDWLGLGGVYNFN